MSAAIIILTNAEIAKPVDAVLIYRPTGKTCVRTKWQETQIREFSSLLTQKTKDKRQPNGQCRD